MNIFVTGGTGNMQDLPLLERSVQGCDAVIHVALAQCPDSPSRITATDEEAPTRSTAWARWSACSA